MNNLKCPKSVLLFLKMISNLYLVHLISNNEYTIDEKITTIEGHGPSTDVSSFSRWISGDL